MGTHHGTVGVRLEDHNHLKYTLAITRVGLLIFNHVFSWGFSGTNIKSEIFKLPNYSMVKFRKDFNTTQRKKLEKNDPVSEFDLSLIYKLIQMLCGLSSADDPVWTNPSDTLENCLNTIKNKRNEIAHESMNMSPKELGNIIGDLKLLFTRTLEKAGKSFAVDSNTVSGVVKSITSELDAIRDSPVPVATLAEYERELLSTRRTQVMETASQECSQISNNMCQVSVAPRLISGYTFNIDTIFTKPILKREECEIRQRQLSEKDSLIDIHKILQAQLSDGSIPRVTLISASSGMGKTSLLRYILSKSDCKTITARCEIEGLDKYDLIIPLDCWNRRFSSQTELINLLLPRTSSLFEQDHLKMALLSLDLLIILDNIDNLDQSSLTVLMEFLRTLSHESRVLATLSLEKTSYIQNQLHLRSLVLEHNGIPDEEMVSFLQRTIRCLNSQADETELCNLIASHRPHLQDHLKSPEILGLIALIWLQKLVNSPHSLSTTVSEIYMLVEELLIQKVLQNLPGYGLYDTDIYSLQSALDEFVLSLGEVAFECIKKETIVIDPKTIDRLTQKCNSLGLPPGYVISSLLYTKIDNSIPLRSKIISFPRSTALHYYASRFLLDKLKIHKTIKEMGELTDTQVTSLQNVAKYLIGILAIRNPSQLKIRAHEIVDILKALNISKTSHWLQYIEESKAESTLTHLILNEMGSVWEVENTAISSVLAGILKHTKPEHLILTTTDSPDKYPHLEEVLKVCSTLDIKLSLHLYQQFWSEKNLVSDKFLDLVVGKSCNLERFGGRLSTSFFTNLPKSLKRLAIHVTKDNLPSLNSVLPSLTNLELLYLNLDMKPMTTPELPLLNLNPNTSLSVDIWGVTEASIQWSCDIAKSLSKTYTRLVLRRSELSAVQCRKWVAGLQKRGVRVSWLVIGSSHSVRSHKERLLNAAKVIGCNKLDWIRV